MINRLSLCCMGQRHCLVSYNGGEIDCLRNLAERSDTHGSAGWAGVHGEKLHKNVAFHCNMSDHSDKSADTEKTNLTHLPLDVLRLVFEFCEGSNFLTATNRYFYNVRRHLYLRLSRKYSLEYYEDEDFRTLVRSRVENPSIQLSLTLRGCSNITDVCGAPRWSTLGPTLKGHPIFKFIFILGQSAPL